MPHYQISASVLSADFARLGEEAQQVLNAGADMIHLDVMDNHYVPNLTMGPQFCEALRNYGITAPIDVHLMIKPVDRIIPEFAKAGANFITFHPEASEHIHRTIQLIKNHDCKPGLVFNPATPLIYLDYLLNELDMILLMAVNPGFGGQQFIPSVLEKTIAAKKRIVDSNKQILLSVDGGINRDTITKVAKAGADTFVVGSAIFHSKNYASTIAELRQQLNSQVE